MNVETSLEMSKGISKPEQLITEHIDIWTSSILAKSTSGRGSSKKYKLYGITKLRELILELAVNGKLIPPDPTDEPAAVLLERIAVEKAQLVKNKKIKKQKVLPSLEEVGVAQNTLPQGWTWAFMPQVIAHDDYAIKRGPFGSALKKSYFVNSGYKVYEQQHAINDDFSRGEYYVDETKFNELKAFEVKPYDLIISCSGTVGKVAIAPPNMERGIINQALLKIALNNNALINNYFKILFPAFFMRTDTLSDLKGTAQKNMVSVDTLRKEPFPYPPLAEQHRIVAKVDELMLLCDQLEQQTEASIDAHATLVEVLLVTLTDSEDADDLAQNWARISEHFDSLFTTEKSIEALKQTVLQLAVMGKLVSQNPEDESASVLLEKIAEEKEQLIKDKKIKKEKPLPVITDEEKLFELPKGWKWCQIESLSLSSDAGWSPKCDPTPKEEDNWGVLKVSAVTWGKYQPDENKALPNYLQPKPQYEVKAGDFLISRANTADLVARSVVVPKNTPEKLMMSDKIIRFNFTKDVFSEYINLVNNSNYSRQYYAEVAGGTSSSMKNVSRNQVRALNIALPPLAEQHRIVAKFEELMAICDQLKKKLKQSQETQVQLTDTLIDRALG